MILRKRTDPVKYVTKSPDHAQRETKLKKSVSELEFEGQPGQNKEVLGVQMYIWEISPAECVKNEWANFPDDPLVKILRFQSSELWVPSLGGELRSYKLGGLAKN